MNIRVMIAEDEKLAREELLFLLEQEPDLEILPSASNGRELLELVKEHNPDVIILDIQMPEMEGIQAARMLSARKNCPLIVFTTAHEDYAIDAFGLNAVDYLLKPYDHYRLQDSLERVRKRLKNRTPIVNEKETVTDQAEKNTTDGKVAKLLIDDGERLFVIDPLQIMYAVREERVIQICTTTQCYASKMTLQQLEDKLSAYPFFRTHRSYLVNLNFVLELVPWLMAHTTLF